MQHITKWPENLKKLRCRHKPTEQFYAIIEEHTNVETTSGTVPARPGDVLMESIDGISVYPLSDEEFRAVYEDVQT